MVAGRSRYYHHLRNGVQPSDTELYRSGKTSVIKYRTVVPYVAWMGKAVLGAANETCGWTLGRSVTLYGQLYDARVGVVAYGIDCGYYLLQNGSRPQPLLSSSAQRCAAL